MNVAPTKRLSLAALAVAPKPACTTTRTGRGRGFTLVEILVAMAIIAMVVVGMTTLLFSMGGLWGHNAERYTFELHARNITRFIEHEFNTAALPPIGGASGQFSTASASGNSSQSSSSASSSSNSSNSGATNSANTASTPPMGILDVRDQTGAVNSLITYQVPAAPRICLWPDNALPNVVCSLEWRDGTGLILLWHSYLETNFDTDAPRETIISPFVTALTYDYYDSDAKSWKNETVLRKDNNNNGVLPQRLRILFAYAGYTHEAIVEIPAIPIAQGLPML